MRAENSRPSGRGEVNALGALRGELEHDPRDAITAAVTLAAAYGADWAITCAAGTWKAERWDGTGDPLEAASPDGLATAMDAAGQAP